MDNQSTEIITAILVSLFGIVNVLITVFISPLTNGRIENIKFNKEKLYHATVKLVSFVSDVTVGEKCNSKQVAAFRKISMQIHMLFAGGKAPEPIADYMEDIYRILYHSSRGKLLFNNEYRDIVRNLVKKMRAELAYYIEKGNRVRRRYKTEVVEFVYTTGYFEAAILAELDASPEIHRAYIENEKYYVIYYPKKITEDKVIGKVKQLMEKYVERGM